ncbi:MAG: hypothetical protein SF339_16335 [Blastocatellia bacterium]|nr:hypothetical protein [Blastocatellia bacterium]
MNVDLRTIAHARLAIEEAIRGHLYDPNVSMIGVGYKEKAGVLQEDRLAIRFHVARKLTPFQLESARATTQPIPARIGAFETDVLQDRFSPQWWVRETRRGPRTVRQAVMRGGVSISNERQNGRGTLGGLVADRVTGERMILSNWHVLAGDWGARIGQRIYQPGRMDGGTGRDTVARLARDAMSLNLDAAVARLTGDRPLINEQLGAGPVTGADAPSLGQQLIKSGCQTEITHGRVTEIESVLRMRYAGLDRLIRKVMVIEPRSPLEQVSSGGDSGSWWLDANARRAVGLHFAGSNAPERALALAMPSVLDALRVEIVA